VDELWTKNVDNSGLWTKWGCYPQSFPQGKRVYPHFHHPQLGRSFSGLNKGNVIHTVHRPLYYY